MLRPPPAPAAPGAFDFGRQAFFQRLGAVGFVLGEVEKLAPPGNAEDLATRIKRLVAASRHDLSRRILSQLQEPTGAVATALMTGERGAIPEQVMSDMRDSGLAHLLAISGLHMGLLAGLLFFGLRALLALWPRLALNYPIKKWAAVATWIGALAYLLMTGATVPTQRAFLMTSLVLLAVVFDRTALSLRLVAWAAVLILLLAPESLHSASFQMSFAAVTALVAVYEWREPARWRRLQPPSMPGRIGLYFGAILLTSIVAIIATSPFAAYHFNRLAFFGLLANLVAVPLTGLWIMPWAVLAFLLMPLDLERLALVPMGYGIDLLLIVARHVASWPGAVITVPAASPTALLLVTLGGLWMALWRRSWRLFGVFPVLVGVALFVAARPPDLLVDRDGKLMAVRDPEGILWLSSGRRGRFAAELWQRRLAVAEAKPWPRVGEGAKGTLSCDPLACIYRTNRVVVSLVSDERALTEDCALADLVISLEPVPSWLCQGPSVVIDRFDLWRHGSHAVWLEPEGLRVETVDHHRGRRPWSPGRDVSRDQ